MAEGVEFDEDKYKAASQNYSRQGQAGQSKMIDWVVRHGLAKTPAAAQWVLLAFVAVMVVLALIVLKAF